jgi:hypothetical protein
MFRTMLLLAPMMILGGVIAVTFSGVNQSPGETGQAALTLLQQGFIGNPYMIPTGPTAHAAPGTVTILALVYGMFGGNTAGARIVLSLLALAQYGAASAWVLWRVQAAFTGRRRLVAQLLVIGALPLFLAQAVVSFRQWDQPTSALLIVLLADVWLYRSRLGWATRALFLTLIGGLGSLFAPILPVLAVIAAVHLALVRREWPLLVATVVGVALLMSPWMLRNDIVLGSPVTTRSNFGLELAVGNNDASDGMFDLATAPPWHPHDHLLAAQRVADIGEVAYMREMSATAYAWIAAHPKRFIELCLHRVVFLLIPPGSQHDPIYRQFWTLIFVVVGMAGVLAATTLVIRRQTVLPWLVCSYLPLAPAILTHADLRYAFPSFFVVLAMIVAAARSLADTAWIAQKIRMPKGRSVDQLGEDQMW